MSDKRARTPEQRASRKADLLLASEVMREHAVGSFDDIGGRADVWGMRALWLKAWVSSPAVLAAAGGGAAFFAGLGKRGRGKWLGLMRWGWLAWRVLRRPR